MTSPTPPEEPPAEEKYERILRQVFAACDVEDYGVGVTTGEDDDSRWIKVTVSRATAGPVKS